MWRSTSGQIRCSREWIRKGQRGRGEEGQGGGWAEGHVGGWADGRVLVKKTALSPGERVGRDGVFISRRGPGEGFFHLLLDKLCLLYMLGG